MKITFKRISIFALATLFVSSSVIVNAQEFNVADEAFVERDAFVTFIEGDTLYYPNSGYSLTYRPGITFHELDPSEIVHEPLARSSTAQGASALGYWEIEEHEARLRWQEEFWSNPENIADILAERAELIAELEQETGVGLRMQRWTDLRPFTHFPQAASNTCGAASARMVVHYARGWAPTESQIINTINDFHNPQRWPNAFRYASSLRSYLDHAINFSYFIQYGASEQVMAQNLTEIVAQIGWPYTLGATPGSIPQHWVVVNGVRHSSFSDGDFFAIADPWGRSVFANHIMGQFDISRSNLRRVHVTSMGLLW
jgi:hypothetical protein